MTTPSNCPTLSVDPFADGFLEDPYPYHHDLREAGPVVWLEKYGVYALARYEHVCAGLEDWETFCSSRGVGLSDFSKEKPWRPPSIILEADPPLHTKTRRVLMRVLSKPALQHLAKDFRAASDGLIDRLVAQGDIDAVRDLAEAYPLSVFPDAIGLCKDGREHLLPYGNMAFNAFGPRNKLFEESFANAQPVVKWITRQCQREELASGGIGEKIYLAADDGAITYEEAGLLVRSLLTAGLDTTIFGIGAMLYCFARFEDQWQVLRETPALVRGAFEEALRFVSPVQTFMRTTTHSIDIDGVEIPEGEKVVLFLASANRDPRKWDEPDRFDISRKTLGHVGFGRGIHVCVGQMLARLEAQSVLSSMLERVQRIELTGDPQWRLNNTLHGLDQLPVTFHA
ncbi:MAG: cytochrome P450 [Gammaproteobacteria bacterium]